MSYKRLRFRKEAVEDYRFIKQTNPAVGAVISGQLEEIDDRSIRPSGQRATVKGQTFYKIATRPGVNQKIYLIVWSEKSDGHADVAFIGLYKDPMDR